LIKINSSKYIWLWVAIEEPENKMMLGFSISKEQNLLIDERSVSNLVKIYGQYPTSTYMVAHDDIFLKLASF
jgi:hypothetical protein